MSFSRAKTLSEARVKKLLLRQLQDSGKTRFEARRLVYGPTWKQATSGQKQVPTRAKIIQSDQDE